MRSRTWLWIGIAAVVLLVAEGSVMMAWRVNNAVSSHDCQVVHAMIAYNNMQNRLLDSKSDAEQRRMPSIDDFQTWADGFRQYADVITDPTLSPHVHRLADVAEKYVRLVRKVRAEPVGFSDPWVRPLSVLATQFHDDLHAVHHACADKVAVSSTCRDCSLLNRTPRRRRSK